MEYGLAIGAGIACAIVGILVSRRIDAERLLFGWGLVIAAFWYIGFGLFYGQSIATLTPQFVAGAVFLALAILGLRKSIMFLSIGWAIHIFWDYLGPAFGEVRAPWWTAPACLGFDVLAATYLFARYKGYLTIQPSETLPRDSPP